MKRRIQIRLAHPIWIASLATIGFFTGAAVVANAQDKQVKQPTVLITGSSRGIGFALARQYAEMGWGVVATCRSPETADDLKALSQEHANVYIEKLDVTSADEVNSLAEAYRDVPIDVLINNAGILGDVPDQRFGNFGFETFDKVIDVNVKGPLRVTQAFIDNVVASDQKKIIGISSVVGSIEMNFGGQVFYRASKAALNMSMKTLAVESNWEKDPERKKVIFGLVNPGVVDTDFAKGVPVPMIQADESAAAVIARIEEFTVEDSGTFVDYTGKPLPW